MPSRENTSGKSLEELATWRAKGTAGSEMAHDADTEFLLRQAQFQERQAIAAEASALASQETARATAQYTKYMLWSVLVLAVSSFVTLVVTICRSG